MCIWCTVDFDECSFCGKIICLDCGFEIGSEKEGSIVNTCAESHQEVFDILIKRYKVHQSECPQTYDNDNECCLECKSKPKD